MHVARDSEQTFDVTPNAFDIPAGDVIPPLLAASILALASKPKPKKTSTKKKRAAETESEDGD